MLSVGIFICTSSYFGEQPAKIVSYVKHVKCIASLSECIISLKMNAKLFDLHFNPIYTPTADADETDIKAFYTDLQQEIINY